MRNIFVEKWMKTSQNCGFICSHAFTLRIVSKYTSHANTYFLTRYSRSKLLMTFVFLLRFQLAVQ